MTLTELNIVTLKEIGIRGHEVYRTSHLEPRERSKRTISASYFIASIFSEKNIASYLSWLFPIICLAVDPMLWREMSADSGDVETVRPAKRPILNDCPCRCGRLLAIHILW